MLGWASRTREAPARSWSMRPWFRSGERHFRVSLSSFFGAFLVALMAVPTPELAALAAAVSKARLELFVRETFTTQGTADLDRAWALMTWNAEVSSAFWAEIGWVELVVRNAIDRELARMSTKHPKTGKDPHWFHHTRALGFRHGDADRVDEAVGKLTSEGKAINPQRVVAMLNFGFWRHIVAAPNHENLWVPQLHHAFPGQTRVSVESAMVLVHDLRNRPICKGGAQANVVALHAVLGACHRLVGWAAPPFAPTIVASSRVARLINARP